MRNLRVSCSMFGPLVLGGALILLAVACLHDRMAPRGRRPVQASARIGSELAPRRPLAPEWRSGGGRAQGNPSVSTVVEGSPTSDAGRDAVAYILDLSDDAIRSLIESGSMDAEVSRVVAALIASRQRDAGGSMGVDEFLDRVNERVGLARNRR